MTIGTEQTVVVFGGSGFLGRYVTRALARRGHRVRVACRRPDLAYHLQITGNMGQVMPIQANLRYPETVERVVRSAHHVVNLVGILSETGAQKFGTIQAEGAQTVARAAEKVGAAMVQMSAIGADESSAAEYARTKARGEKAVFEHRPDAVILRPSIVFGPEDKFFNRFANMSRFSPFLPLIGGGHTKFQPIYVGDVAEAVADAVEGKVARGRIYELGGPEVLTFRQMMEEMLSIIERRRRFLPISFPMASSMAKTMRVLPGAPITPDQVEQLKSDNVVSQKAKDEGRTIEAFHLMPKSIDAILPTYLVRFRPEGQFNQPRPQPKPRPDESSDTYRQTL